MFYFDNAATTRPLKRAVETARLCLLERFGNPSSLHSLGAKAAEIMEESRKTLAGIFQVPMAGVTFCASGTESDNLAVRGIMEFPKNRGKKLITSRLEHAAILKTAEWLENRGVKVEYVKNDPDTGQIDLEHLERLTNRDAALVSIQHVNSETGIAQDLAAVSRAAKSGNPNVLVHSDGVQAFGRIPVDLRKSSVDLYSISAHKFHGIRGGAALIMTGKIRLEAMIRGGGQEFGLRSGTENVAAIAAMGTAAETACRNIDSNHDKVQHFSDWLKQALKSRIPEIKIFETDNVLPYIISLSVPGVLGENLLHHLEAKKIYVGTGSACGANLKKLSSALQSLNFSPQRIKETIRVSPAAREIPENRDEFLEIFVETVRELSDISS